MKIAFALCALGFLSLGSISLVKADGASADIEKAITALEMTWTKAETENKIDLIEPLIANPYMATDSDGKVTNREEFFAAERATQFSVSKIDALKVSAYGNTAIANYALRQKGTEKGKTYDRHTRWTDIWVKMPNGSWQCVASHGSAIKAN